MICISVIKTELSLKLNGKAPGHALSATFSKKHLVIGLQNKNSELFLLSNPDSEIDKIPKFLAIDSNKSQAGSLKASTSCQMIPVDLLHKVSCNWQCNPQALPSSSEHDPTQVKLCFQSKTFSTNRTLDGP